MKKSWKRRLALPLACLGLAAALCGAVLASGRGVILGSYLRANDGSNIVVEADGAPVVLSDRSAGGNLFGGLSDGDRVLVVCSGINASWPGQAGAYWCFRLGPGEPSDIPGETLQQLAALGWLSGVI